MNDLKIYYWDKVLTDYSHGCAIALAHNVEEAREMVVEKYAKDNPEFLTDPYWEDCGSYVCLLEEIKAEPKVYDINTKNVFYCEGGA